MKSYKITTKNLTMVIEASSRLEATRKWFQKIKKEVWQGKSTLEKLGHIAMVHEKGKEDIPFRIAPAIYVMGLIDKDTAIEAIRNVLDCNEQEAISFLGTALLNDTNFVTKSSV